MNKSFGNSGKSGGKKTGGSRRGPSKSGDRASSGSSKPRFDSSKGDRPFKKFEDRDSKPRFGGDEKPFKKFGDRDSKPRFGGDDKPRYGDRDSKPRFGGDDKPFKKFGDRDSKPRFGSDDKPRYGDRDSKPRFGGDDKPFKKFGDRDSKPRFGGDDKPRYGDRDSKPRFGGDDKPFKKFGDRDSKPRFGSDDKPRYGDRDSKPRFGGDDKPFKKFGDRDSKPRFGGDDKPRYGDRDSKPRFGGDDKPFKKFGDRDSKPRFGGDDKPRYGDRDSKPRFGGSDDRPYKKFGDRDSKGPRKLYTDDKKYGSDTNKRPRVPFKPKATAEGEEQAPKVGVRLNKYIANSGICSRRDADKFIADGLITVNDVVVTEMGVRVLPGDVVKYADETVKNERLVYLLLNKPKDHITTMDDPQGRKTVYDLVANACKERTYPVGRLDRNTTGVLLLTNDGDLAEKLMHPKFNVSKQYHVRTDKNVKPEDLEQLIKGVDLEDGVATADEASYHPKKDDRKEVIIRIHSGRNRVVRRMFEALGYDVLGLDRISFAGLNKKHLKRGEWRFLTATEVGMLKMQKVWDNRVSE